MGYKIIEKAGHAVKHALGALVLCWRRMARAGLISGVIAFVLVEIVSSVLQQTFPAPALTHVVALIFAMVLAYATALTVLIDELFIGAIDIIRALQGEVGAGARAIAIATERRVGEAAEEVPYSAEQQRKQTQADIEATDQFLTTAPRPRVNARPVQASQLPRIRWALEQMEREGERFSAPRVTRPITRPLALQEEEQLEPAQAPRGIWSRISKTLVGNAYPPVDGGEEEETAAPAAEVLRSEET